MKKILLGTTAVVALATMSTEAFAADKIKLGLGGFMRHYVGVANHDEVAATANTSTARKVGLQQWANTEVYFTGATTLDNGLNVSVMIQREADKSTATRNDVSEMTISSDAMGALTIGSTPHAGDDFRVGAPNATKFDFNDTDKFAGIADVAGEASDSFENASVDITNMGNNAGKLKYVSPSFSGVQAFISYTAAEDVDASSIIGGNTAINRNTSNDGSTMGLAYGGEVSGVSVSADLTHFRHNGNVNVVHGGLNLGMAGFTIGGGYSDFNDDSTAAGPNDGKAWDLGVAYETGPYSVSARYMKAKNKGSATVAGDNEDTKYQIGATYSMGAGVALSALYFHSKADKENSVASPTTFDDGKDATVNGMIAGIEVGF